MPEIGGFELVELLRARGTNVPIVALTALDRADDRQEVLAAGCNDYLIKPAEKWELVRVCQQWMGKPAVELGALIHDARKTVEKRE